MVRLRVPSILSLVLVTGCAKPAASPELPEPSAVRGPTAIQHPTMDAAAPPSAVTTPALRLALNSPRQLADGSGASVELTSYVIESIEASPDDPESYPAGSGVTMSVMVAGTRVQLSELSAGYQGQAVGWTSDFKVELAGHDSSSNSVDLRIQRITAETASVLFEAEKLERGTSLNLGDGLTMEFAGHGHKSVHAGQTSPLIVSLRYLLGNREVESDSHNLFPPKENRWRFRDFEFEIGNYEYDRFMILRVRRLALESVSLRD